MIISASRRTDIPAFYNQWFMNRVKEGYVMVRNPMNYRQVSKIDLNPEVVDFIVFWSKNPAPMMKKLPLLKDYKYYFHFTLNGYGTKIEKNLPPKEEIIKIFQELSTKIGSKRVIWRYDPILLTDKINEEYHYKNFKYLASKLEGYTERCVISFLDLYRKTRRNLKDISLKDITASSKYNICEKLVEIAGEHDITLETCAEKIDLEELGIKHGKCIDDKLISAIIGTQLDVKKDRNQRKECGCLTSIDIGSYNTCLHNCLYCYANYNRQQVENKVKRFDVNSPLLAGQLQEEDNIYNREIKSCIKPPTLFD